MKWNMKHEYTDNITCPYCDHEWQDSWEFGDESGTHTCGDCGEVMNVERKISITYSTYRLSCESDHNYRISNYFIRDKTFIKSGVWEDLPENEWKHYRVEECSKCGDKEYIEITEQEYSEATLTH